MPNIREVVGRIHSISSTQQITKAMKMVAAAKLSKVQHQLIHLRPYAAKIQHILAHVTADNQQQLDRAYTQQRPVEKLLLVVMSADKGLCGSFNANIFKKVMSHLSQQWPDLKPAQIDLCIIGKKAFTFFKNRPYKLITDYIPLAHQLKFEPASHAAEFMIQAFLDHTYDRIELVHNHFVNAASQMVQVETFLPIIQLDASEQSTTIDYIYEPSKAELVKELLPKSLKIQFYKALLESHASEHGSRMTTMSKATDNAEDMLKSLKISYNRSRQASITNEILEIVAGAEALIQ
jgi:F-type H+-transporting ATPase subunit gamma